MAGDRPRYHFLPSANWMNDPNGLIQWNGVYHLFYQYNPHGPFHGTIHWGHASSVDLVHWKHLPIALEPTPGATDAGGCWSGCAIDAGGVPIVMYTGVTSQGSSFRETQCIATGTSDLIHWTKHPNNPVIAAPPPDLEVIGFRDPFVWREDDHWCCIIGTGIAGVGGAILLYHSPDLLHWEYRGVLCAGDSSIKDPVWSGSMWECPQFFPLEDKYVLIVSAWDSGKTMHTVYAVGDYSDERFTPTAMHRLDLGASFYAPATMRDQQGRRLMWGWLREQRRKAAVQAAGWSGVQSLPCVLTLGDDLTLRFTPPLEMQTLRGAHARLEDLVIADATSPLALPEVVGDALELRVVFDMRESSAESIGLRVRRSTGDEEYTTILYNRLSRQLSVDRSFASLLETSYRGTSSGRVDNTDNDRLTLRIFLDRSVLEVYVDDRACLTERIYPGRVDSTGVALVVHSGTARVLTLDAWIMDQDEMLVGDVAHN